MKKIAFFVEGHTELSFLKRLIVELYKKRSINIDCIKIKGKGKNIAFTSIKSYKNFDKPEYFILIYNCVGETNVKSNILEQRESLIKSGYSLIVGIRDLFPNFTKSQLFELQKGMYYGTPQKPIETKFIIPVMEIETWFLAEDTHFEKIDSRLTVSLIKKELSFDPSNEDMEDRISPAKDLNDCYKLVGKEYVKSENIEETINAIDIAEMYFKLSPKYSSLCELFNIVEKFIEN